MKKTLSILILMFVLWNGVQAQEKPLQLYLGTVKTVLKQNAIDFGIKYAQSYDSLFKQQDLLLAGSNSLFQLTPEFNVRSGTADAFSSVDLKLSGLFMLFQTTEVAGLQTPCTNCFMHLIPVSAGVETNNTFTLVNGLLEAGYVPWYQAPTMKNIPAWLKHTKAGVFLQAGYTFRSDTAFIQTEEEQTIDNQQAAQSGILRIKGSFAIDTKSLISFAGVGVGLQGAADTWFDLLNNEIHYRLEGTLRFFLSADKDRFFSLSYQKGAGAPTFNKGDQFGMGLTIGF